MNVSDLGHRLCDEVFKAYNELDGRILAVDEFVPVRIFLEKVAGVIVENLEAGRHDF